MKIADVAIRNPVFAFMLVSGLVVLGLVSIPRLGIDLFPRVELPVVTVTTALPGAAPETVEREVSQVLEETINTIEGIRVLSSASSESLSLIYVEFELEYDVREKAQEVREKVAAARGDLPRDAEPPVVDRLDPDALPILAVMLSGPYDIRALSELADKEIKTRLERISGVGSVTLVGHRPREVRVWIDPLRLAGYGLAVDDVLAVLEREHAELPAGRLETSRGEWTLRALGKLAHVEQFGALVVADRAGRTIRLSDVARIEDGMAEERTVSRLNGRRGVALQVRRQSGENTVAVAHAVKQELEGIRAQLAPGYEMTAALDASVFIRSAIRDVALDMALGVLLASAVVLLFLRNPRSTVIAAVAIPSSLIASFAFFYFLGFTLNTLTLLALSLSIGLLIDDAIVVLENVYRHMEEGSPPMRAASQGTAEIGLAVVATTLAICAVFVPIAFLSGVVGRFFREFGLVAAFAVATSTLIALTLTPMLCSRFLRVREARAAGWRALATGQRGLERVYRRVLGFGLRHRFVVVALALAAVGAGVLVARAVPVEFVIAEDRSEFNVWLKGPLGSDLEQTRLLVEAVERELHARPEVRVTFATIGAGARQRVHEAEVYVQLVHKSRRAPTQQQIMADLRQRIATLDLPLDDLAVEEIPFIGMPGSRSAQLMYSFRGPDVDELQRYAVQLMERMREAGGYADLYLSHETGRPEVALEIQRASAADLNVPVLQIGRTLSTLFAGHRAATFEEVGHRYDVRVQVLPEFRDDLAKLDLVRVRADSGVLVPLPLLVTPRVGSGPVQIRRESRARAVTLLANLDGKSAGAADGEITRMIDELALEPGYQVAAVGTSERLRETTQAVSFAFALALVAIYMILASQFNSFVHPFTIMLSAPLSFIGAFAAVAILGYSLDLMGQIAFLMLMGIVMKNGILLVDYTNALRSRGMELFEAALEAGAVRMRPVLMTAVSTICGMLPVAIATGDGSEWRNPMGAIAIGGLATSTLLTLLVVPVVYTLLDDAQSAVLRGLGAVRRRAAWAQRTAAPAPRPTRSAPAASGGAGETDAGGATARA